MIKKMQPNKKVTIQVHLGRGLLEGHIVQFGELFALFGFHLSQFGQIAFGGHTDEHRVSVVQVAFHVVQPVGEIEKRISIGYVVDQKNADRISKVAFDDAFELLLTGCVPVRSEREQN